jgi:hypothetical protein
MSEASRVQWTIVQQTAPQPWLNCPRCGGPKPFRSSGKLRQNANGRRLDAWLVYKCKSCECTWNRPILERQPVRTALAALGSDQTDLVRRLEFDVAALGAHARRVDEFDDVVVSRQTLSQPPVPTQRLDILCIVPQPTRLRLDRLLASELRVSRRRIQALAATGSLTVFGGTLRKAVRDGVCISIDLAACSTENQPISSTCR